MRFDRHKTCNVIFEFIYLYINNYYWFSCHVFFFIYIFFYSIRRLNNENFLSYFLYVWLRPSVFFVGSFSHIQRNQCALWIFLLSLFPSTFLSTTTQAVRVLYRGGVTFIYFSSLHDFLPFRFFLFCPILYVFI